MSEYKTKSLKQSARGKEHILSLRGEAEAISKCEIPRGVYPEPSDKILRYAQNDRRRRARNDKLQVLTNQKGIALVMALVLSVIALTIISALMYFVTQGTSISGFQKRYQTAQEAAQGGVELTAKEIISRTIGSKDAADLTNIKSALQGEYNSFPLIFSLSFPATTSTSCLRDKLLLSTFVGATSTFNWPNCNAVLSTSLDPKTNPDISLTLAGIPPQPNFSVFAKIVDTIEGNSDSGGLSLEGMGVTESGSGMVTPQHVPFMYRIEVQGERSTNPDERANFSVLYAF